MLQNKTDFKDLSNIINDDQLKNKIVDLLGKQKQY